MDQVSLNRLLAWLDSDRDVAARKLVDIGIKATKVLVRRGCYEADVVWDETVERVARKLPEIEAGYVGDPALYFYAVARMVLKEWIRPRPVPLPIPAPDPSKLLELYDRCLTTCLDRLSKLDRKLILEYFGEEGRKKIDARNAMAEELGININALRTRAHRIKKTLKKCVFECIGRKEE